MFKLFSRGAAENFTSECLECCSKIEIFMKTSIQQLVSNLLPIRPVTGFSKQLVDSTIDGSCLIKIYDQTWLEVEIEMVLPPCKSYRDSGKSSRVLWQEHHPTMEIVQEIDAHFKAPNQGEDQSLRSPAGWGHAWPSPRACINAWRHEIDNRSLSGLFISPMNLHLHTDKKVWELFP